MPSAAPPTARRPRPWLLAFGAVLLGAFGAVLLGAFRLPPVEAREPDLARCVTYALPAGWGRNAAAPEHLSANTFFAPETWTWTGRKLRDHVQIVVFSEYGVTMAKARLLYESAKLTEGIRAAVELTAHEFPDRPLANIYAPPQAPTQQRLTVGGRPSVRYDTEAGVQLDEEPPVAVHATVWLVDVRGTPFVIETGYPVSRAAQVAPLVDAFVGSIGFDACP